MPDPKSLATPEGGWRFIVSIDPGYAKDGKGCGVAVYYRKMLEWCGYCRAPNWTQVGSLWLRESVPPKNRLVVYERPQCDSRSRFISPETLIWLTAAGAELAGLLAGALGATLHAVTPSGSKGSVSKPLAHERMLARGGSTLPIVLHEGIGCSWSEIQKRVTDACEEGALDNWKKKGADYYHGWHGHNILDAVDLGSRYV